MAPPGEPDMDPIIVEDFDDSSAAQAWMIDRFEEGYRLDEVETLNGRIWVFMILDSAQ